MQCINFINNYSSVNQSQPHPKMNSFSYTQHIVDFSLVLKVSWSFHSRNIQGISYRVCYNSSINSTTCTQETRDNFFNLMGLESGSTYIVDIAHVFLNRPEIYSGGKLISTVKGEPASYKGIPFLHVKWCLYTS
jgi:hypothetical protein